MPTMEHLSRVSARSARHHRRASASRDSRLVLRAGEEARGARGARERSQKDGFSSDGVGAKFCLRWAGAQVRRRPPRAPPPNPAFQGRTLPETRGCVRGDAAVDALDIQPWKASEGVDGSLLRRVWIPEVAIQ